jgi:hypothetical protein
MAVKYSGGAVMQGDNHAVRGRGHIQIISNFIMISIRVDVNGVEGRVEPRKLGGQLS